MKTVKTIRTVEKVISVCSWLSRQLAARLGSWLIFAASLSVCPSA
jgi:hypothetical protein